MSESLARIKNLYFPINDYHFNHGPRKSSHSTNDSKNTDNFLGREDAINSLRQILTPDNDSTNKGTYLVAGYRGMGKTTVVRKVVSELGKEIEHFELYLSQNEIKDEDILRQLAVKLINYIKDNEKFGYVKKDTKSSNWKFKLYFGILMLISFLMFFLKNYSFGIRYCEGFLDEFYDFLGVFTGYFADLFTLKEKVTDYFLYWGILTVIIIFPIELYLKKKQEKKEKELEGDEKNKHFAKINNIIQDLENRLFSSLIVEDQPESNFQFEHSDLKLSIPQKILNASKELFEISNKKTKSYTKLIPKEMEYLITELLDEIQILRNIRILNKEKEKLIPDFIFIFDELDKIEPDYYFTPNLESTQADSFNILPSRKRVETIANLLANLKSFLCNAQAKFIFIGGRSMYEAALADISDRESFYSSIFNRVIYIPSFYKDKENSSAGVSQLTEVYLCKLLLKNTNRKEESANIDTVLKLYEDHNVLTAMQKFKILHTLQNFFIFLTYRTNGSPKKLIEIVEKYIVDISDAKYMSNSIKDHFFENANSTTANRYLKLNYRDQYEINLTSNFYRPYTIQNSRHLKLLNDKLLYSTAFLMDHILKFHKTAFSWNNLELLPDIILSNNDPNFRSFFMDIMNNFQDHFIRKTTNAIFQYKFQSKIVRELRLLSKRSEFSSAAINFTLDESFHLKSHYKRQLYAKIDEYKRNSSSNNSNIYIHSIGYLYTIIGDLYYYDEEYDDAVIYYADALQPFRNGLENIKAMHQLLLYTSIKLKLGLCLEKMRSYDRAYSIYRSLILETKLCYDILKNRNASLGVEISEVKDKIDITEKEEWEPPYKRIQSFMRSHIALLGVIEKQRQDGITYYNLERNIAEYIRFLGVIDKNDKTKIIKLFPNNANDGNNILVYHNISGIENESLEVNSDNKRIVSLITDYYLTVGSILFFKNQIFYKFLFETQFDGHSEYIKNAVLNKHSLNNISYHPSQASYLYFLHALITFYVPFQENIEYYKQQNIYYRKKEPNERNLIYEFKFTTSILRVETYKILNTNQFEALGNIFGKLGNSLLSCLDKENIRKFNSPQCIEYLNLIKCNDLDNKEIEFILNLDESEKVNPIWTLICYRFSYLAYQKAGKSFNAYYACHKIIKIYDEGLKYDLIDKNFGEFDWEGLIMLPVMLQTKVSNVSNRLQITKYFDHLKWQQEEFNKMVLKNLSTAPEIRELILCYESIQLSLKPDYQPRHLLSPFTSISSMYLRILELAHQVRIEIAKLDYIRKGLDFDKFFDKLLNEQDFSKIKDSTFNGIFCIHEAIRILNNFGIDYTINYSMKAELLKTFGQLSIYYLILTRGTQSLGDPSIKHEIVELVGEGIMHNLDAFAHFDHSIFCFEKVIQLHTEGSTYKEFSQELFALDDDLNDSQNHFNASLERMKMNAEYIKNQIDQLKLTIRETQLNSIKHYLDATD